MILNIMTWNTALTENAADTDKIFRRIEHFLERPNGIAVLQQIPFRDPEQGWELHQVYQKLLSWFPEKNYSLFQNHCWNRGYVLMETVVLSNMKGLREAPQKYYPNGTATNRECAVALRTDDGQEFVLLGIHARAKNNEENADYLRSINGEADVILGDFNAGDYPECDNSSVFADILKEHVCICNLPTRRVTRGGKLIRKTCIDHVFVKRSYVTKCSDFRVHENVLDSDHAPITFQMEL